MQVRNSKEVPQGGGILLSVLMGLAILGAIAIIYSFFNEANAEGADISWSVPTDSEACSVVPGNADLSGYRIYELVAEILDPAVVSYNIPSISPGDHTYIITSITNGEDSRPSPQQSKTAGDQVVIDETAFTVVKTMETFLLVAVGTVPVGTVCDSNNEVNGHQSVPIDQITWTGSVRPVVAVAKCG